MSHNSAMNTAIDRLLFEASSVAANFSSAPHRLAAAKEAAAVDVQDLATSDQARAYLAVAVKNCVIALALREAVIALALLSREDARAAAATGIRALVDAARAEPNRICAPAEPRLFWVRR